MIVFYVMEKCSGNWALEGVWVAIKIETGKVTPKGSQARKNHYVMLSLLCSRQSTVAFRTLVLFPIKILIWLVMSEFSAKSSPAGLSVWSSSVKPNYGLGKVVPRVAPIHTKTPIYRM